MGKKLTLDIVKERIGNANANVSVLSKEYKNAHTPLELKCAICRYKWKVRFANLIWDNSGCPRCAKKLKHTIESLQNKVVSDIQILSDTYINSHSKLHCRCKKCNFEWFASADKMLNQKTGCPRCSKEQGGLKRRKSLNYIKKCVGDSVSILSDSYNTMHTPLQCRCKVCKFEWTASATSLIHQGTGCPRCARSQTKGEKQIESFLNSLNIKFISNDRKTLPSGKELDFYLPDFKIGIELNGEFWHSSAQARIYKNYHLDKTRECEALGIHLFQFWHTNEIVEKSAIVYSMLKNALHTQDAVRIYARECKVREISAKEGACFCHLNSIHGKGAASLYLGLFYQGVIVSVMSFGKSRFDKKVGWEIIRQCSLLNHSIIGGASKLLTYFERNYKPKSLLSYANRRFTFSEKNWYKRLGFSFLRATSPNYFYLKDGKGKMYSRIAFQRHKLEKIFGKKFSSKLTERQIMQKEGFVRIYDCGNLVYLKEYGDD